jgi:membrane-associated protease RseP (regulator of RpoE activity)
MIHLEAHQAGTRLRLLHSLPEEQEIWSKTIAEVEKGWPDSLENLVSVLETGEDLRFTRRPMLGILPSDFSAEVAEQLGVPVNEGIRIDDVVDGLGAQAAGLQGGDVIVDIDGRPIRAYPDLNAALEGKRAGQHLQVTFYRHAEKKTVDMELSRRPLPELPDSMAGVTQAMRAKVEKTTEQLEAFCQDLTEAEAAFKPSPTEWSIQEVLAHLIHDERYTQFFVIEMFSGFERWADDFGGNVDAQVLATVAAHPTLAGLLGEWKHACAETIALYENLPAEILQRKVVFWRLAYSAVDTPYHFYTHLDQMKTARQAYHQAQAA